MRSQKTHIIPTKECNPKQAEAAKYDVVFDNFQLKECGSNSLTLEVPEGDLILLLEDDATVRNSIINALTRNIEMFRDTDVGRTIRIGGKPISALGEEGTYITTQN